MKKKFAEQNVPLKRTIIKKDDDGKNDKDENSNAPNYVDKSDSVISEENTMQVLNNGQAVNVNNRGDQSR